MKKLLLTLMLCLPCFADTGWLFQPLYTQGTNNPSQTATAGHVGTLYFNNANTPSQVYIKTDDYPSTNWVPITNSSTPFFATCTQGSATATNIVHCLPSSQIGTGQQVFLEGFHAYVNGSTSWTSTVSCQVQDTAAVPFFYITALSANTYYSSSSSGVTRFGAFQLGSGGTSGDGLDLVCTGTGSGSNLNMVLYGVTTN